MQKLLDELKKKFNINQFNSDFLLPDKSWGFAYSLFKSPTLEIWANYVVKGGRSSWHVHDFQYNRFFVISGRLELLIEIDEKYKNPKRQVLGIKENKRICDVTPGFKHRFKALEETVFIEVVFALLKEDDIYRFDKGGIDV